MFLKNPVRCVHVHVKIILFMNKKPVTVTVTALSHTVVNPRSSVAVHVTWVFPRGNHVPMAGEQLTSAPCPAGNRKSKFLEQKNREDEE